jgi:hypothetical protein
MKMLRDPVVGSNRPWGAEPFRLATASCSERARHATGFVDGFRSKLRTELQICSFNTCIAGLNLIAHLLHSEGTEAVTERPRFDADASIIAAKHGNVYPHFKSLRKCYKLAL